MPYRNLIIHSIEKEQFSDTVIVVKSKSTIDIDDESIEKFCDSLVDSYRNDNRISNTKFKENSRFKGMYDGLKKSEKTFVECTSEMVDSIASILELTKTAKGGKFVFIEAQQNGNDFFYVFLIRDTTGGQIKYSSENSKYVLNSVEYADTNNLAMAARVNYNIYKLSQNDDLLNYLSFTYSGNKQDGVSDYFANWLGASELHKNSEYAIHLRKAILKIGDFDEAEHAGSATEKLQLVLNYAMSNEDDIINIYSLSEHLYGPDNRNLIRDTCDENNFIFTERFKLITTSKNLFRNISVKVGEIKLQFPRIFLENQTVKVSNGVVVIDDSTLAEKIIQDYESKNEA
ncbi:nucleoid-associated protein [Muricauda oceani]|uniref:Nucleoid-associated protein n=1 Tax=Flagellimonas oceani TaxID=2698672 RepID=A0A6G7J3I7_9FLAO|nr:nucleoid-associated protein [Allomuricauda oceani]MBW8244059.1 nucleoid-associated protein [Allomuricauda oceani]QII45032.1 hypothetical protein GVT53_10185 [Allomuricauda oceani]